MLGNPWGVGRHAHLALVHTSIEHSRDWCRSLLILDCQELAAQQPPHLINWCIRLLKMTSADLILIEASQKRSFARS
ncbi:resolvase (plasmid) [Aeromonas sp. ASNIH5]|nr:resolvase [Aeromonas sp. ASNIH5]